ncbi:MAG: cytochrome c [Alphaproteobacteria bacterium]|nr:cytochrome c [Alphaproteobacteria bacterium]MDP6873027.1 cytochrome c [Alphaproteobacteria bacterium]
MKKISPVLIACALLGAGILAATQASGGQTSDPTAASAWSAGNAAGLGNFMSYCMPCHGETGKGDGMLSEDLDVKPRNLAEPAFLSSKSDEHLFKVIKDGGAAVGLTENMTPFAGQLSDKEIRNVIAYLRKEICKCEFKQ